MGDALVASEKEYLAAISAVFSSTEQSLIVGIGDDAAVVSSANNPLALATDMAVEGTHFTRKWSSLFEIGAKVTAANLADIYAMGGRPRFLLVATGIPDNYSVEDVRSLAEGIADEASKVGAIVVGGDIAKSRDLVIAISVYGDVLHPLKRSDAKVGDLVAISDLPGASARGLSLLQSGVTSDETQAHRRPDVNYQKVAILDPNKVHALCDISDGLVSDLGHIAEASNVSIHLAASLLLGGVTDDAKNFILHGGEDHHFVGTFPGEIPPGWIEIGRVEAGTGVYLDAEPITHEGFSHFK
jgi:thiamine-monophosphate kinase